MKRVLILDGEQRSALATTRALGHCGHEVWVGSSANQCLASTSKYCSKTVVYNDPSIDESNFLDSIITTVNENHIDVLLPMTDLTVPVVLNARHQLRDVGLPYPSIETYLKASDKFDLFRVASEVGVPVPKTIFVDEKKMLSDIDVNLAYPIIVKPARSRLKIGSEVITTQVVSVDDAQSYENLIKEKVWLQNDRFLLQERIVGTGQGIFALYDHGSPLAFFAHNRIREKPPSGGVSVFSESIRVNSRMQEIAEALLTPLQWHGAAMVEFKVALDGTPYLIEINGRLWGSLQLAIDSGMNFPSMLMDLATKQSVTTTTQYRIGCRNRWLLGDFDHLLLQVRGKGTASSLAEKLGAIGRFLNFFSLNTRLEVLRFSDIKPFFRELWLWLGALFNYDRRSDTS